MLCTHVEDGLCPKNLLKLRSEIFLIQVLRSVRKMSIATLFKVHSVKRLRISLRELHSNIYKNCF